MNIAQQAEIILAKVQAAGAQGDLILDRGDALSLKAQIIAVMRKKNCYLFGRN